MQKDLLGDEVERERKRDEKNRAALHARWLEEQDAGQVEQLLQGVHNGFRRKRKGVFGDEVCLLKTDVDVQQSA